MTAVVATNSTNGNVNIGPASKSNSPDPMHAYPLPLLQQPSSQLLSPSVIKISKNGYITSDLTASNKKPIILLCGWLDGQYEHIVKYLEMYNQQLHLPVIMLESISMDITFYLTSFVHNDTAKVLKHVLPTDSVFIPHIMSNGGIRSFLCLKDNFAGQLPVKAMIFDSCPSVLPKDLTKADKVNPRAIFFTQLKPEWLKELLLSFIINIWIVQKYWYTLFPQLHILNIHFTRLTTQFKGIPKLFLYSDNDTAIPSNQVEKAIDVCRQTSPVSAVNFVNSPHVRHLQVHREKYIAAIVWFLRTYLPRYVLEEKLANKSKL